MSRKSVAKPPTCATCFATSEPRLKLAKALSLSSNPRDVSPNGPCSQNCWVYPKWVMTLLAGLEIPPPGPPPATIARPPVEPQGYDPRVHRGAVRPGRASPGPAVEPVGSGRCLEPPAEEPDEDTPRDGRQLLGWASKQIPDLKGVLIGYGKKKGLHSKIVEWTPQQVAAAYRFARARSASTQ